MSVVLLLPLRWRPKTEEENNGGGGGGTLKRRRSMAPVRQVQYHGHLRVPAATGCNNTSSFVCVCVCVYCSCCYVLCVFVCVSRYNGRPTIFSSPPLPVHSPSPRFDRSIARWKSSRHLLSRCLHCYLLLIVQLYPQPPNFVQYSHRDNKCA